MCSQLFTSISKKEFNVSVQMEEPAQARQLTLHTKVVAVKDQISCDLSGEAAILNLKTGIYFGLNEVGARIWSLISEPQTVGAIKDVIVAEYDVTPERCERDLVGLLQKMAAKQLIEVKNETDQ